MLSTPYYRPWCTAAPWDPRVYALLTALSMQHCVLPTQCSASYRLYYALSKRRGSGVSVQKQQDVGCVRGTGDVLVLYGLNVVLSVLMDPLLLLLHVVTCVCVYVCVCLGSKGVHLRNCPFHRVPPWHSWSFSPVSANYWRERCGELSVSWRQAIVHSEDQQYGIVWPGVF